MPSGRRVPRVLQAGPPHRGPGPPVLRTAGPAVVSEFLPWTVASSVSSSLSFGVPNKWPWAPAFQPLPAFPYLCLLPHVSDFIFRSPAPGHASVTLQSVLAAENWFVKLIPTNPFFSPCFPFYRSHRMFSDRHCVLRNSEDAAV